MQSLSDTRILIGMQQIPIGIDKWDSNLGSACLSPETDIVSIVAYIREAIARQNGGNFFSSNNFLLPIG